MSERYNLPAVVGACLNTRKKTNTIKNFTLKTSQTRLKTSYHILYPFINIMLKISKSVSEHISYFGSCEAISVGHLCHRADITLKANHAGLSYNLNL